MFFVYRPQTPTGVPSRGVNPSPARRQPAHHNYDPDEAFVEFKRREYIAALEEAEQRAQFRVELVAEEERHRRALEHIAAQEVVRRQNAEFLLQSYAQQAEQADQARQVLHAQRALQERQRQATQQGQRQGQQAIDAQSHPHAHPHPHSQHRQHPNQPTPQEILRRRLERQKEEERRSREFHRRILTDVFGVPVEIEESSTPVQRPRELPKEVQPQQIHEPEQPENEDEPHWSEAPERARALAEIASINRAFLSLKNTFSFPSGQLERIPNSDVPKLAYNPTNASIHAYEHALSDLLSKLDGIESHGFKGVRMARKQLVVKIEEELLALERKIAENLAPVSASVGDTSSSTGAAPAAKEVEIQDVEMAGAPSHTPNPAGYDIEVEDVLVEPTPSTGDAVAEPTTTIKSSTDAETAAAPASTSALAPEASTEPTVEPTSNTSAAPIAPSVPGATTTATAASALPAKHVTTISVSDEEDEVDDAVHVITTEDGTKADTTQEEGYELL